MQFQFPNWTQDFSCLLFISKTPKLKEHVVFHKLKLKTQKLSFKPILSVFYQCNEFACYSMTIQLCCWPVLIFSIFFQDAFNLFVEFAKDVAGIDAFTADAWVETLKVVVSIIGDRMNELAAGKNTS